MLKASNVASTSTSAAQSDGGVALLHSAWNPYTVLPPKFKRRVSCCCSSTSTEYILNGRANLQLDPTSSIPATPFQVSLELPPNVVQERLASKFLQLEPPQGKESDQRKAVLAKREHERTQRRVKRIRENDCGLIGRRKRKALDQANQQNIRCDMICIPAGPDRSLSTALH